MALSTKTTASAQNWQPKPQNAAGGGRHPHTFLPPPGFFLLQEGRCGTGFFLAFLARPLLSEGGSRFVSMPRNKGVAQRKKRNGEPAGERSAPAPKRVKVPILDAYGVGTLVCKEFKPHGMFTGKVTEKWIEQRNHRPIFRVEYADGDTEDLSLAKLKQVAVQALPPPAVPDLGSPPRERKPRVGARISQVLEFCRSPVKGEVGLPSLAAWRD